MKHKLEGVEFFRSLSRGGGGDEGSSMKPEEIRKMILDNIPKQLVDEDKYKKI